MQLSVQVRGLKITVEKNNLNKNLKTTNNSDQFAAEPTARRKENLTQTGILFPRRSEIVIGLFPGFHSQNSQLSGLSFGPKSIAKRERKQKKAVRPHDADT